MMVMVPCTVSGVYCVLHTILGLSGEDLGVVLEVVELERGGGRRWRLEISLGEQLPTTHRCDW